MKFLRSSCLLLLLCSSPALASWHYNENGGFGIYQPEGWLASTEGRLSRLSGPEKDSEQSEIFLGSDWISRVNTPGDLEAYANGIAEGRAVENHDISGLPGFRVGDDVDGAYYVLRVAQNVIVVDYNLRGSAAQLEEGRTMLGSIEIRTKGNENDD